MCTLRQRYYQAPHEDRQYSHKDYGKLKRPDYPGYHDDIQPYIPDGYKPDYPPEPYHTPYKPPRNYTPPFDPWVLNTTANASTNMWKMDLEYLSRDQAFYGTGERTCWKITHGNGCGECCSAATASTMRASFLFGELFKGLRGGEDERPHRNQRKSVGVLPAMCSAIGHHELDVGMRHALTVQNASLCKM